MNRIIKFAQSMTTKASRFLDRMIHNSTGSWWDYSLPGTNINYEAEIGKGLNTNVFMAPIMYIARNWGSAFLSVRKFEKDSLQGFDHTHPLAKLIRKPNKSYSGTSLWFATIASLFLDGNAYWFKIKGLDGQPGELWYAPHWSMEPKGDKNTFITHYEYQQGMGMVKVDVESVVHLKFGMDPENVRKGYSPLKSGFREAYMDHEASNLIANLLRNKGIPGIVISPDKDQDMGEDDAKAMKQFVRDKFTGDRRGEPIVLSGATRVSQMAFNPQEMDLSAPHNLAEERICALIGLPAAIVGFGSGMESTKVGATLKELKGLAWTDCIAPMQDMVAEQLTDTVLPDFQEPGDDEVAFDRSEVGALQENRKEKVDAHDVAIRGGWAMVSEGREAMGWEVKDSDKVYLRSSSVFPVDAEGHEVFDEPNPNAPTFTPGAAPAAPAEPDDDDDDGKGNGGYTHKEMDEWSGLKRPRLTQVQARLLRSMDRLKRTVEPMFRAALIKFFDAFGKKIEAAWLEIEGGKALADDELRIHTLFSRVDMGEQEDKLGQVFATQYTSIQILTEEIVSNAGLVINVPDSVALQVLRDGHNRAPLVNLADSGQRRAFKVLAEAREKGWGIPETARKLRHNIPAGPWSTSAIRAQVVARTETRIAQTHSSLRTYQGTEGVRQVMMLDNRLGPQPEPDLDMAGNPCADIDGIIVSFERAEELILVEHPNGTRDMVPVFEGS